MIPVFRPSCTHREVDAITEALASGWWGRGPRVEELEERWSSEFAAGSRCVAVNSGTAALELAVRAVSRRRPGTRLPIVVPSQCFASPALVAQRYAADVTFADCDLSGCTAPFDVHLAPYSVLAVIVCHYGGRRANISAIRERVGPGVPIIADCAHAPGAFHPDADYHCWSFHAVKPIAAGDGGMVSCPADAAEEVKRDAWLGIQSDTWERARRAEAYRAEYDICIPGLKCHMNDLTAALVMAQIDTHEDRRLARRDIAAAYNAGLKISGTPDTDNSDWHLYQVSVPFTRLNDFRKRMAESGVATGRHYRPAETFACFGMLPKPNSRSRYDTHVTLPLYSDMTDDDVRTVIEAANRASEEWR